MTDTHLISSAVVEMMMRSQARHNLHAQILRGLHQFWNIKWIYSGSFVGRRTIVIDEQIPCIKVRMKHHRWAIGLHVVVITRSDGYYLIVGGRR
jgi:hypothetical protein